MKLNEWRETNKFRIQAVALGAIVSGSFGLYAALTGQINWLAAVLFGVVALGMAVTMWVS